MASLYQDRYEIVKTLGSGGFGEVYLARDRAEGDRLVALKILVLPVEDAEGQAFALATFRQEFAILTQLSHPHICRVYDYGTDAVSGECYFSAEFIEGTTIAEATAPLSCAAIEELFAQGLRALGYLHSHGIVHGDIKPHNLLVTTGAAGARVVRLLDFGLSERRGVHRTFPRGTLKYMAPEQFLPDYPIDPRSDLYAVGLLFYELFTRHYPFRLGGTSDMIEQIREVRPLPPSHYRRDLPPYLEPILMRLLAKQPDERFSRADRVITAINLHGPRVYPVETCETLASYAFTTTLIARDEHLGVVRAIIAGQGAARHAVIAGEAGCGKTRLLREGYYAAQLHGAQAVWIEDAAHFRKFLGLPLPGPGDDAGIVRAAQQFLSRVTHARVVVCCDNVETYDPTHRAVLIQAIRALVRAQGTPGAQGHLLVAIKGAPSEDWQGLVAEASVVSLTVSPFDRAQTRAYLEGFSGMTDFPDTFLDRFCDVTGGNPRLCEEILRHLIDAGQLRERARLVSIAEIPLPPSGVAAVVEQWKALPPLARDGLRWLAVYQQPIAMTAFAQLAGWSLDAAHEAAAILETARLLRREDQSIAPANQLVMRAVSGAIPETERLSCHRRIAEWLSQHHDVLVPRARDSMPADAVSAGIGMEAYHWSEAREPARAVPLLIIAGREAWGRSDTAAALRWWEKAIATADDTQWQSIAEDLVRAYAARGVYAKGTALCEAMRRRAAPGSAAMAFACRGLGWIAAKEGWFDKALPLLETALDLYQSLGATEAVLVQNDLGHAHLQRNDRLAAITFFSAAWETTIERSDIPVQYVANNQLATALALDGRFTDARAIIADKVRTLQTRGEVRGVIGGYAEWGRIATMAGTFVEAKRAYLEAITAAEQSGALHNILGLADNYIGVCQLLGTYREAFQMLDRALQLGELVGTELDCAHCWMTAANLYASVGVFAQARQYGERARVVYERRGMPAAVGWTYYSDGCWTDEEGDEVAALQGLTRALEYAAAAADARLQAYAGLARAHLLARTDPSAAMAQYGEATTVGASLDEEEWRYRQAFTACELAARAGTAWSADQMAWIASGLTGESRERRIELYGLLAVRDPREEYLQQAQAIAQEVRAELDEAMQDDFFRQRRLAWLFPKKK